MDNRKNSFSHRLINEWNKLSNDCINISGVNMSKAPPTIHLGNHKSGYLMLKPAACE